MEVRRTRSGARNWIDWRPSASARRRRRPRRRRRRAAAAAAAAAAARASTAREVQRRPPVKEYPAQAYVQQEHFFSPVAAGEARAWACGQRVHAHMPGCACPDRPRNMPLDSVALRKERGSWVGTFVLQCDPHKYANDPLGAERELSARLGEGGVRVECWGREALNTPLTAETDVRLVNEHFEDIAAPSLLFGLEKEMEQLCDVGRELAPVANAAPCAVPWSVLARATDASDDEFGKELARLELSAFLEAQGLAVVRNDAPPLVEQSCPDLAACAPLLPTFRGDANQPLADLRVLLAAHLVEGRLVVGLPRASRARLGELPAHAAARGAHEVLALRLGVLDDAGTALKTVQPHAKTGSGRRAVAAGRLLLRCLAVDDGTAPTQLTVQNGEFVPQLFVPPPLPHRRTRTRSTKVGISEARAAAAVEAAEGASTSTPTGARTLQIKLQEEEALPLGGRNREKNEKYQRNFPQPRVGFKKPPQRKVPRNFSGKDPKSVVCCYFLRDMCKNGDELQVQPRPGLSWRRVFVGRRLPLRPR